MAASRPSGTAERSPSTASRPSGIPSLFPAASRSNSQKREAFVMSSLAGRRARARSPSTASSMSGSPSLGVSMTSRGFTSGTINYISSPIGRAPLPEDSPPPSPLSSPRRLGPLSPKLSIRSPVSKQPTRTPTNSLLPIPPPSPTSPSIKRRKRASDLSALLGPLASVKPREIHLEDGETEAEDDEPDWGFTGPLRPIMSRSSAGESVRLDAGQQPSSPFCTPTSTRSTQSPAVTAPGVIRRGSGSSASSIQAHGRAYHYVRQGSFESSRSAQSHERATSGVSGTTLIPRKKSPRGSPASHLAPQRPQRPPSLVSDLILQMWDAPLDAEVAQQLAAEVRQARPPPSAFRKTSAEKATALHVQAHGGIDGLGERPLPSPTPSQVVRMRNSEMFADPYRPSASPLIGSSTNGRLSTGSSIRSNRSARRKSGDSESHRVAASSERPTSQDSKSSSRRTRLSTGMDGSVLLRTPSLMSHRASTSSILSRIPPLTPPPSMAIPPTPDEMERRHSTQLLSSAAEQAGKATRHQFTDTKEIILGFPLPPTRASEERDVCDVPATSFPPRPASPDLAILAKSTPRPKRRTSNPTQREDEVESDIDLESPLATLAIKERIIAPRSPSFRTFVQAQGGKRTPTLSRKDSAQMLRTGRALTRGLGWSDSEDDDLLGGATVPADQAHSALSSRSYIDPTSRQAVLLSPGRILSPAFSHVRRRSSGFSTVGSPSADPHGGGNNDRESGHWRSVSTRSSISNSDHLLMTPNGNMLSPPARQALEAWGEPEITIADGLGDLNESDETLDAIKMNAKSTASAGLLTGSIGATSPPSSYKASGKQRPTMPRRQSSLPIAAAWGAQRSSVARTAVPA